MYIEFEDMGLTIKSEKNRQVCKFNLWIYKKRAPRGSSMHWCVWICIKSQYWEVETSKNRSIIDDLYILVC